MLRREYLIVRIGYPAKIGVDAAKEALLYFQVK